MNASNIVAMLNENDLAEVEVLRDNDDALLVNFYYDFDKDVLDAAKAYADEECGEGEECEDWFSDYYWPYLYDFANDEVLEIIEDISEQEAVAVEMVGFQITEKRSDYVRFMVLFTEEDSNLSIDDVVKDYMS